ncbi:MAG: hypothetical protein GY922_14720 [Proteobacteria bacterium]|jgi:hypothetical protein|nr:hypothetical protein [Pseudomonadota bacterium]
MFFENRWLRKYFLDRGVSKIFPLLGLGLIFIVSACSDRSSSTSSSVAQTLDAEEETSFLLIPEVKDLLFENALAQLRQSGFFGEISRTSNGKCQGGDSQGKVYKQLPGVLESVNPSAGIHLFDGCFDVRFVVSEGGFFEPIIDSPDERTGQDDRFNISAYNSLDFSLVPHQGYEVSDVNINGQAMTLTASHVYRLSEITADQTVEISFSPIEVPEPEQKTVATFTIRANVLFGDCVISPSGNVVLSAGESRIFKITSGTLIQVVNVDGVMDGACSNVVSCSRTFANVSQNHDLDVICN